MREPFSRRDFLKLSAVGAAATAILVGCRGAARQEPTAELKRKSFDKEFVIFNGKTVSVNELSIEGLAFYSDTRQKVKQIIAGDRSIAATPSNYKGNAFPDGWELDPNRTAIMINQSEDGGFFSQAIIGRRKIGEVPLMGEGGSQFVNGFLTASAYNEHSLLVVGRNNRTYWFDNVESENESGRTRIVVDGKTEQIYQITTNKRNLVNSYLSGEESAINVNVMDINARNARFEDSLSPASKGFIKFLEYFINRMPTELTAEEKMKKIEYFFSGARLKYYDVDELKKLFGEGQDVQQIIDAIAKFRVNIPYDSYELAFVNSVLAKNIKELVETGDQDEDWSMDVKGRISPDQALDSRVIDNLVNERISLPVTAPEVYFLKLKTAEGNPKWFAVGRYPVWENDVDRTAITSQPNGFGVNEGWFTFGEVDEQSVVNNSYLRPFEKIVDGFPFDDVKSIDSNPNKPLQSELFGGMYGLVEARQVKSDAIGYGWDPAEGNPKHKVNPGFFLIDGDGEERFLKLTLDSGWGSNIDDLPLLSNRPMPLLGNSVRVIKDVSDSAIDLITRGQVTASPFLMNDFADYSLVANINSGPGGYLNYDFLYANNALTPKALESLVPPDTFMQGGADNSMIVFSQNPEGQQAFISVRNKDGHVMRVVEITHPVIVSPLAVEELTDGQNYIKVAEDGDLGDAYYVLEENVFPLGARSTATLTAIGIGEAAALIAALYGGYRIVGAMPGGTDFLKGIIRNLTGRFIH